MSVNSPKLPLLFGECRIWTPSIIWFLWPTRVSTPNAITIGLAVFVRLTNVATHRHRDRQTGHATFCNHTQLSLTSGLSLRCGLKMKSVSQLRSDEYYSLFRTFLYILLLSTHAERQGVDISFNVCVCLCLYVRLRISPPRIKLAASNFAQRFISIQGKASPIFVNFAPPQAENRTNRPARHHLHDVHNDCP